MKENNNVSTTNKQEYKKRRSYRSQELRNPVIPAGQQWLCVECKFVLGYTNSAKTELRMKFKDQYITVYNPERVECACRRCGKFNVVGALSPSS